MEMTEEELMKDRQLIRKAKDRGFSYDTMFICGVLAFSKENRPRAAEILDEFIRLIDETKDEDEFVEEATGLLGL